MLSQAIQVGVVWQLGPQAEVLGLKNDACSRRIEENFASLGANDGEGEWVRLVLELDVRFGGLDVGLRLGAREDALRDLVDAVGSICDLDVNAVIYFLRVRGQLVRTRMSVSLTRLVLDLQGQALQIGTIGIAGFSSELQVGGQRRFASLDVRGLVAWTFCQRIAAIGGSAVFN